MRGKERKREREDKWDELREKRVSRGTERGRRKR